MRMGNVYVGTELEICHCSRIQGYGVEGVSVNRQTCTVQPLWGNGFVAA